MKSKLNESARVTAEIIIYLSRIENPVSIKTLSDDLEISQGKANCYLVTLSDENFAKRYCGHWDIAIGALLLDETKDLIDAFDIYPNLKNNSDSFSSYKRIDAARDVCTLMRSLSRQVKHISIRELSKLTGISEYMLDIYLNTLLLRAFVDCYEDEWFTGIQMAFIRANYNIKLKRLLKKTTTQVGLLESKLFPTKRNGDGQAS